MADEKKQEETGLLDDLVKDKLPEEVEGEEQEVIGDAGADEEGKEKDTKDDSLDDLLASLDETAGQFLGAAESIKQTVQQEEPIQPPPQKPRYEAPLQMTAVTFEKPVVQISQNDFDDAVASPAGLQRYTEKVIGAVIQSLQKPVNDGLAGVANYALQNALTKSVETLTPVVDHRIQTQATIDKWWRRNSDLEPAANLVGVAANRILAKNPKIQLAQLLDESGKEVRATIVKLKGQQKQAGNGKKPGFVDNKGKGTGSSKRKQDSIMAQLGMQ
jgi:hypothetical protein